MIITTYQSREYAPGKVKKRYVQAESVGGYFWVEVGENPRYDIRQGHCSEDDLPRFVVMEALRTRDAGVWPFYVEWPL